MSACERWDGLCPGEAVYLVELLLEDGPVTPRKMCAHHAGELEHVVELERELPGRWQGATLTLRRLGGPLWPGDPAVRSVP